MPFVIERNTTAELSPATFADVLRLCDAAYAAPIAPYLASIGAGEHLLGRVGGVLVSHLMWVTRWLQPGGSRPLRTAYVELVATAPTEQRRGYATRLLRALPPLIEDYDLAALSPATDRPYVWLGWRYWRGPLATRKGGHLLPDPDERVMIRPLPQTPALDVDLPLSVEWRSGEVW